MEKNWKTPEKICIFHEIKMEINAVKKYSINVSYYKYLYLQVVQGTWMCFSFLFFFACSVAKSCLTLCDSMDCRPPGLSVHGNSQQEYWSGCHFLLQGISWPRDWTASPVGEFFTTSHQATSLLLANSKSIFFVNNKEAVLFCSVGSWKPNKCFLCR